MLHYAKAKCLVSRNRLMRCLVQELLLVVAEYRVSTNNSNSNSNSNSNNNNNSSSNNSRDDGVVSGSNSSKSNADDFGGYDFCSFLKWANSISSVVGLQAYRMLVEIKYRQLLCLLEVQSSEVDRALMLGSFRHLSGKWHQTAQWKKPMVAVDAMSHGSVLAAADFQWEPRPKYGGGGGKSGAIGDALNEIVTCVSTNMTACELSIQLLLKLREILRTYSQSPHGIQITEVAPHSGPQTMKITETMINDLSISSAFHAFEVQCCQLQKISVEENLASLSINERLLFFCNLYNTLTVHGIIAKGSPGSNLLERASFMRSSKYNVGGSYFSLLDIEHGILRASSTKAMYFGPLTISITFGERDVRRLVVIGE